jgi:hypothetical protein
VLREAIRLDFGLVCLRRRLPIGPELLLDVAGDVTGSVGEGASRAALRFDLSLF